MCPHAPPPPTPPLLPTLGPSWHSVQGSDTFAEAFAVGDDIVEALDGIGWGTPAAPAPGSTRKMLQFARRCASINPLPVQRNIG